MTLCGRVGVKRQVFFHLSFSLCRSMPGKWWSRLEAPLVRTDQIMIYAWDKDSSDQVCPFLQFCHATDFFLPWVVTVVLPRCSVALNQPITSGVTCVALRTNQSPVVLHCSPANQPIIVLPVQSADLGWRQLEDHTDYHTKRTSVCGVFIPNVCTNVCGWVFFFHVFVSDRC